SAVYRAAQLGKRVADRRVDVEAALRCELERDDREQQLDRASGMKTVRRAQRRAVAHRAARSDRHPPIADANLDRDSRHAGLVNHAADESLDAARELRMGIGERAATPWRMGHGSTPSRSPLRVAH